MVNPAAPDTTPEDEQDQPDLDAMAERLGVVAEGDEPDDAPSITEPEPAEPYAITAIRKRRRALALAIAVPAATAVIVRQLLRKFRRS